jgi:hypothetical protein
MSFVYEIAPRVIVLIDLSRAGISHLPLRGIGLYLRSINCL